MAKSLQIYLLSSKSRGLLTTVLVLGYVALLLCVIVPSAVDVVRQFADAPPLAPEGLRSLDVSGFLSRLLPHILLHVSWQIVVIFFITWAVLMPIRHVLRQGPQLRYVLLLGLLFVASPLVLESWGTVHESVLSAIYSWLGNIVPEDNRPMFVAVSLGGCFGLLAAFAAIVDEKLRKRRQRAEERSSVVDEGQGL